AGGHQRQVRGGAHGRKQRKQRGVRPRRAQAGGVQRLFAVVDLLHQFRRRVAAQQRAQKRFVISAVAILCVIFVGDGGADFLQRRAVAGRVDRHRVKQRAVQVDEDQGVFFVGHGRVLSGEVRENAEFWCGFWPRTGFLGDSVGGAAVARRGIGRFYAAMHPSVTFGASSPYRG